MQARLTAFVPDAAAITCLVGPGETVRIGRAEDCGLRVAHRSISRVHAELADGVEYWRLTDLRSKNGSFVDGAQVSSATLRAACWLRFGDVHCEFTPLDGAAAEADAWQWRERQRAATAYTVQLASLAHAGGADARGQILMDASLRAATELAGCTRGFLLIEERGEYRVRAALALDPADLAGRNFAGSRSAVLRALEERRAVVLNEMGSSGWQGTSASVILAGLRTLVCLPLLDGEHALGVIYVDRREPGPPLTTLELELLEAFADRAALWLSASRASDELIERARQPLDWDRVLARPVAK